VRRNSPVCFAIPIFSGRVAPRFNIAEAVLFVVLNGYKVVSKVMAPLHGGTWVDLLRLLKDHNADMLVCGGINRETRELVESRGLRIIDNVCCTADEAIIALERGELCPGFGFVKKSVSRGGSNGESEGKSSHSGSTDEPQRCRLVSSASLTELDCLACSDRVCLRGEACWPQLSRVSDKEPEDSGLMLEAARDIALEKERTLCRLSELIYFCLEMKYRKIGVAFCIDLLEATDILVRVLRRFFEVHPICCKVGGRVANDPWSASPNSGGAEARDVGCNPQGQAEILNKIGTDINVLVGLCMGADCVLSKCSKAPVSTLFVKDKSLANNPIGALYSDYYLKEATRSAVGKM
jgi:uncharacterized metal-binding protein/predicted Fe-Mo cluster-binding NifX family protein